MEEERARGGAGFQVLDLADEEGVVARLVLGCGPAAEPADGAFELRRA